MNRQKIIKLKLEGGAPDKLPQLKESAVDTAVAAYRSVPWEALEGSYYNNVVRALDGVDVRPEKLQEVMDAVEKPGVRDSAHNLFAGIFLSALVNTSSRKKFKFRPKSQMDWVGYSLEEGKELTVDGNVGIMAGREMTGGRLHIRGDARTYAGCDIKDGEMLVDGSVGDSGGQGMIGGTLTVKGDAGSNLGNFQSGGRINVEGEVKSFGPHMMGGEIYNKGERVWPK
ncbi:MAG: hypothetical protein V1921_06370 [Candidatus Altiarchaeota archaeon]